MSLIRRLIHGLAILLLLAGGVIFMVGMVRTRPAPPTALDGHSAPLVDVTVLSAAKDAPPVIGFGTVRPKHQLHVIPQVAGKLVQVHKDLAAGKTIPAGELVFAIEPTIYEARVLQAQAEVEALHNALQRHDSDAAALEKRLVNARSLLAIDEGDLQASQTLFEKEQVGTRKELDLLRQKHLRSFDIVLELQSAWERIPALKVETRAHLDAARARLRQAEYDLANTRIVCPFRARVDSASVVVSQVVTGTAVIATLTDVEAFEIPVGLDPADLRWLHRSLLSEGLSVASSDSAPPVIISWMLHGRYRQWRGFVSRIERVDVGTRTAQLVVEVRPEDRIPSEGVSDGMGLTSSLTVGMYCRVEFPSEPLENALWMPRTALSDDHCAYVWQPAGRSDDDRAGILARRRVSVLRVVDDRVLVDHQARPPTEPCEVSVGDAVIVSPLTKPVMGMNIRRK